MELFISKNKIARGIKNGAMLWDLQHDGDKPSDEWFYYSYYLLEYEIHENNSEIIKILEKNGISRDGEHGWLYPWEPGASFAPFAQNLFMGLLTPKRKDMRK